MGLVFRSGFVVIVVTESWVLFEVGRVIFETELGVVFGVGGVLFRTELGVVFGVEHIRFSINPARLQKIINIRILNSVTQYYNFIRVS